MKFQWRLRVRVTHCSRASSFGKFRMERGGRPRHFTMNNFANFDYADDIFTSAARCFGPYTSSQAVTLAYRVNYNIGVRAMSDIFGAPEDQGIVRGVRN
jgi:hypothetical protein